MKRIALSLAAIGMFGAPADPASAGPAPSHPVKGHVTAGRDIHHASHTASVHHFRQAGHYRPGHHGHPSYYRHHRWHGRAFVHPYARRHHSFGVPYQRYYYYRPYCRRYHYYRPYHGFSYRGPGFSFGFSF